MFIRMLASGVFVLAIGSACKKEQPAKAEAPPAPPSGPTVIPVPLPIVLSAVPAVGASASASAALSSSAVPASATASAWSPPPPRPLVVSPSPQVGFVNVKSSSLGVELEVPERLAALKGNDRLMSADRAANIRLFEHRPDESLDQVFAALSQATPKRTVVFKQKKAFSFVVSGLLDKSIYYDKVLRIGARNLGFSLVYPESEKDDWSEAVKAIAASFRALGAPAPKLAKGTCRTDEDCGDGAFFCGGGFCVERTGLGPPR